MESRIMQVFYDNNLLPYKDSERAVHYPIVGNSFAGSNLTNEIHFYIDQIGGTDGISWVIVSKLPNGKIGYEPLSTVVQDSLLGENYLLFSLSSYYTSVKGDLYLALRGYKGTVTFTDTNDDGIYEINGDPLIEVTGTIKLAINYSPMINTGTQVLPSDVDRLIAALSNYALRTNTMRFYNYNASGKTIADIVDFVYEATGHNYACGFNFTNLTEGGSVSPFSSSYIGVFVKGTDDKYYFEIERYASGTRASQDRWVGRQLTGTELLDTILTPYNEYYAPYLVNGNNFNYDTATFSDLYSIIGEVPHIIRLTGTSEDSSTYGGFFLVKLSSNVLTARRLTNVGSGIDDFYFGTSIPSETLLSAIFNHSSSYYKPYARKSELKEGTMTFVRYNASGKTIADLVTYLDDGANITHSFWFEGITYNGRYIGFVIKNNSDKYDLELERYGANVTSSVDRWVANDLTGNELINNVLSRTSDYYKPYALKDYVDSNFFNKYSSGITNSTTLLQLEEIIGSEPCYI